MTAPEELPRWAEVFLMPLLNVALALLVSGLVVWTFVGMNPLQVGKVMLRGAFGDAYGFGTTLYYATTFVFAGLSVAVAFHAGLFNIGADGQGQIAGIGITLACLHLGGLPAALSVPIAILAGLLFGAAWAFVPGYLQARRGSHIVITTIMFNFIASAVVQYLLVHVLKPAGESEPKSDPFPDDLHLPLLSDMLRPLGLDLGLNLVNLAFPLALLAAVLVWILVWRTRLGYAMRTVGHNPAAAVYGGISPARITMAAMMISGALAGLMGVNILMGDQHKMILNFTAEAGFVGIAVSLMGRSHPLGIVLASILFGALIQGGQELTYENQALNRDLITVIQGLVILFVGAFELMFRPHLAALFRRAVPTRTAEA